MYSTIVLAYDGTREGRIALREGAICAKQWGAETYLLSVVSTSTGMQMAEAAQPGTIAEEQKVSADILDEGVQQLRRLGLDPTPALEMGEPAGAIAGFAKRVGASLVVVGHRHRGLLARWWSTGTSASLLDVLDCSLLVASTVISDETFEAEMLAAAGR